MKKIVFTLAFSCTLGCALAQYVVNYKRAADAYFEHKDYYAAAALYKKALNIQGDSSAIQLPYIADIGNKTPDKRTAGTLELLYRLAEASRLYKNFKDAEIYYGMLAKVPDPAYADARYWYGVSLRANMKYEAATRALDSFMKAHPGSSLMEEARLELASARFAAEEMREPGLVQLRKLGAGINTTGSNYAPAFSAGTLYFTSSRPIAPEGSTQVLNTGQNALPVVKKANPYINILYEVKGMPAGGGGTKVKALELQRPEGVEFGAPAFNASGSVLYLTAWQTTDGARSYAIWTAFKKEDNSWSAPVKLEGSVNSGNAKQPFVTSDDKYLVFSSDRPGGQGKYDLWYASLRTDGSTGQPVNMGPVINTRDDEEAPYYNSGLKRLLFSSNGKIGLGGFDFYESFGDFIQWSRPENMGYPFNSSKDDIYFTAINSSGTEGYISSDRASLCCLELFHIKTEKISVSGTLSDCVSAAPLANARVTLTYAGGKLTTTTNDAGRYTFTIAARKPVALRFALGGYFEKTVNYSQEEIAHADTLIDRNLCLTPFKVETPIVLKNIYFAFNSDELNAASAATLDDLVQLLEDNEKISIELSAHTDAIGSDAFNLDLSARRANACVAYLVARGIAAARLTAMGYGETRPLAPNTLAGGKDNPAGRALNRRVEFKVLEDNKPVVKLRKGGG